MEKRQKATPLKSQSSMFSEQPHGRRGGGVLQRKRMRKPTVSREACPDSRKREKVILF